MASTLSTSQRVLERLAERVRTQEWPENQQRPYFTPLVDLVGDIGRALAEADARALHGVLPSLATLREALEGDYLDEGIEQAPWRALAQDKAAPYAAGALWACSAAVNAVLTEIEQQAASSVACTGRQAVRAAARELAASTEAITPGEVQGELLSKHGLCVDRSTVSKGIGDLLARGELEPAPPPQDADRRHRYYRRSADAEPVSDETLRSILHRFVSALLTHAQADELERLMQTELRERFR